MAHKWWHLEFSDPLGMSEADLEDWRKEKELTEYLNNPSDTGAPALTSADLADIRKEEELTSLGIEQGIITQQTSDALNKDRQAFTDPATGKTYADKGDILSPKNRRKLDKKEPRKTLQRKKSPPPPPVLRYPFEGMTQHTDYLQIDVVEYKPPGNKKIEEKTRKIPFKKIPGVKHDNFEKIKVQVHSASFKGKLGGRANSSNNLVGGTRSYALSRRPIKSEGTILLPIPSNVQDGNSVKVGDNSLNGLQAAGAAGVMDVMSTSLKDVNSIQGAVSKISTGVQDAASKFKAEVQTGATLDDVKNVALSKLTASVLGIVGGNVTTNQLMARAEGQILNPNMELLFDGPTLRAFKFQFKMTPRNPKEAEQIKLIIRSFKRNMAPIAKGKTAEEKEGAWFLKTPKVFELRYRTGNKDHEYLHKFKQCFLTDVAVNYTGDGVYATYDDGSPVSYLMDLSFKELEPIYDIDYDTAEGQESVGY